MTPILMAEAAKKGIGAQRTGVEAARREIAYRITEVYYNIAGLDRLIQAATRARELADERLLVYDKRRTVGTDGDLPTLRAQVEKSRAEQDLLRAQLGREQLLEVLGILLGEAPPTGVDAPPPAEMPAGNMERWVDAAMAERPDIAARKQALDAQKTLIREAELRWLPVVAANGTWRMTNVKGFTNQYDSWFLQLNVVLPLFDRGQRYADLAERRTAMARLEAELDKSEQDTRAQLRQANVDVLSARKSIEIARKQSEIARKSAEIAAKSQAAGVSTAFEVAEADTNVRLSEANEAREQVALDLAILKLRHLTGMIRD
jgi:outer membrane protein TolC